MSKSLKFGIVLLMILCVALFVITFVDVPIGESVAEAPETPDQAPPYQEHSELVLLVESALANATGRWKMLEYRVEHIKVQDDGQMALIWLAAYDPETGELLAREPELALASLNEDGSWQVLLEDDPGFDDLFFGFQNAEMSIQGDIISAADAMPMSGQVFGGYYLPWAAGLEKRLTWSVGHTSCTPIHLCTHAFDFADGTMFPIVAAKGGTVFHWRDSCPNNSPTCNNSITLQDRSTDPWTYQIYIHIAQNSVPSALKQVGAPVLQGQFIANADNTGPSTGHHLHFQVVTEHTRYFSAGMQSWFGVAEDITFRDVSINWHAPTQGGRPRLPYEADFYGGEGKTHYISSNKPAIPPTGGLSAPANKAHITNQNLAISGWGQADFAVAKMEIMVNYDGSWVKIGSDKIDNPFTTTLNLCDNSIPNGPFTLGLRVWDFAGNPSHILTPRKLIKNVECGPSGTNPGVSLIKNQGTLVLPQNGFVSAEVARDSTESNIKSVEFWFHPRNWTTGDWVYLGKDTNGSNGWQAPLTTAGMPDGNDYTIVAVATDAAGNRGVDLSFQAVVDSTLPWINFGEVRSPVLENSVTINWTGGDNGSGLDYYSLEVNVNGTGYQTLESFLPGTTTSYTHSVEPGQLLVFALTAHDKAGNQTTQKLALYTEGYEFQLTGGLSAPANKIHITNQNLTISGWGQANISVAKMEIMAKYDGSWVKIGSDQTANPFTTTVNLCNTSIPNGPFTLGLRVWDHAGNPSQIMTPRKLIKNVECSTAGTNPSVSLIKNEGTLALPQNGFVSAEVTRGSTGSNITSVEFWFHPRNWTSGAWVYLGKDTNGSNGWQVPINTAEMPEGNEYTILVVVTDAAGNKGLDVSFQAIVDSTPPRINFAEDDTLVLGNRVTIHWVGDDALSGLDYFTMEVSVNGSEFHIFESALPKSTTSYTYVFKPEQLLVFNLTAYDKSGNHKSEELRVFIDGYVFPYEIYNPLFYKAK